MRTLDPRVVFGRIEIKASSSASQLTVFRNRSALYILLMCSLSMNAASPKTTSLASSFPSAASSLPASAGFSSGRGSSFASMFMATSTETGPLRSSSVRATSLFEKKRSRSVSAQLLELVRASETPVTPCGRDFSRSTDRAM